MPTLYVICRNHPFTRSANCGAVAVSCYRTDAATASEIGFEATRESLSARRLLVARGYEYCRGTYHFLDENKEVFFSPDPACDAMTAKIVSKDSISGTHGVLKDSDVRSFLLKSVTKALDGRRSVHRDSHLAAELGEIHASNGVLLQYWPFFTEYESVCYIYGSDQKQICDDLHRFFFSLDMESTEEEWPRFPVY